MSGGPSSRPTNASCEPSGEKRGRLASPTPAVRRYAGPPLALTRHRSSSHVKTRSSPCRVGKRKYPRSEPTMLEILTKKRRAPPWFASAFQQQQPQHVRQDAPVAVVLDLNWGVDATDHVERELAAVRSPTVHAERLAGVQPTRDAADVERLEAGQGKRLAGLTSFELQRQDTHAHQVAAVDTLEALRDDRADAEQQRAFGRPVAGTAAAVLLPGDPDQWHPLGLVLHRGVEDPLHLALRRQHPIRRQLERPVTLSIGHQLVAQADVAKRAAHHHLVVAAARAIRVEVAERDAVVEQIAARGGVLGDRTSR